MLHGRHAAPSSSAKYPAGPRHSVVHHRWQTGAVGAAVVAVVFATLSGAWGAPDKILQDVQVKLASDGTVTEISNVVIRRSGDGEGSSDTDSMDPAQWASKLPVRIQTTYQLGDKAGTNLDDLKGEDGTAVIDVTIQNLTAKPEEVEAGSTQMALVGTPMTVVASAEMGRSGLNRVITKRALEGAVTNGVVGSNDRGDVVQWASLLVPPQLAPTATFRLVLSGKNLQAPQFNISIQPRLVTDLSTGELLKSAFDPDRKSSAVALQRETVELVSGVNDALDLAAENLATIRSQLDESAGTLGRQTYQDLLGSTKALSTQMQDVGKQLNGTQRSLGQSLTSTQSSLDASLKQAVDDMKTALGDPASTPEPTATPPAGGACVKANTFGYPGTRPEALSVYQHVLIAEKTLEELTRAGRACAEQIGIELAAAIDIPQGGCTARSASAKCAIKRSKDSIAETFDDVRTALEEIQSNYHAESLYELANDLDAFDDSADEIHEIAEDIGGNPHADIARIQGDLDTLSALVQALRDALSQVDLDEAYGALDEIEAKAATPALTLVPDLIEEFCNRSAETLIQDIATVISLDIGDCEGDLKDELDGVFDEIENIAGHVTVQGAVEASIANLIAKLNDVDDDIADLETALIDHTDGLATLVANLLDKVEALERDVVHIEGLAQAARDQGKMAVDDVQTEIDNLENPESDQNNAFDDAEATLTTALTTARDVHLQQLITGLDDVQAKNSATRANTQSAIQTSRLSLDTEARTLSQTLGSGVSEALNSVNAGMKSSTKSIDSTRTQLLKDLNAVLVGIGSPSSRTGLIGVLEQNAQTTDEEAIKLDETNGDARRFRNSHSASHQQAMLEWHQLDKALAQQNNFAPFGLNVAPTNSLSVFSFTLG